MAKLQSVCMYIISMTEPQWNLIVTLETPVTVRSDGEMPDPLRHGFAVSARWPWKTRV